MLLAICMIFLLSSCAKMPVFESKSTEPEKEVNSTLKIADHSDAKKNIDFGIANDNSNLYLQVNFHKQDDLMKIMRGGLHVYFDPSGKKKKNNALVIERIRRGRPESNNLTHDDLINMAMNNQAVGNRVQGPGGFNSNVAELITKELEKVTWKKNDKEVTFYRNENNNPIVVDLESNSPIELVLTVKIPLTEISVNPGEMVAIGIETGTPGNGQARSASTPQNGGMSGGMGGGGGGRGGGRGGGGNMGGGGMPGGAMGPGQSSVQPYRFWFLAQL